MAAHGDGGIKALFIAILVGVVAVSAHGVGAIPDGNAGNLPVAGRAKLGLYLKAEQHSDWRTSE